MSRSMMSILMTIKHRDLKTRTKKSHEILINSLKIWKYHRNGKENFTRENIFYNDWMNFPFWRHKKAFNKFFKDKKSESSRDGFEVCDCSLDVYRLFFSSFILILIISAFKEKKLILMFLFSFQESCATKSISNLCNWRMDSTTTRILI